MLSYAYYRLPLAKRYTRLLQHEGVPERILSLEGLNGREGFVVAPFAITDDCPLLLMYPDEVVELDMPATPVLPDDENMLQYNAVGSPDGGRGTYHIDFCNFHAQLEAGEFRKLVLAREEELRLGETGEPMALTAERLFLLACQMYPRLFVALVSTPQSGTWLTATPEILLEGDGQHWCTIALAGTKEVPLLSSEVVKEEESGLWSAKNIQEQRYVATYMVETLEQFSTDINEVGPYTVRAGHLVHLRSDFNFTLPDSTRLGSLLQALHPSPAVCGLPKREAFQFICRNEFSPRRYYSGFMGPLHPDGNTHLYVSLRCMQIIGNRLLLYAGGGLLRDSIEEQEWAETEAKLETMRRLMNR